MINLLPEEEKQKLFLKKKEKLALIWGFVVLVALICLTLILLSIEFYILSEADNQKSMLMQAEKETKTPDFINLSSTIQKYNATLAQLDSFYKKETYFNRALNIITSVPSPQGIYLTNFSLDRGDNGIIKASVSGTSDTRNDLLSFQESINAAKEIKSPYFSPESWINPKDIDFSLTFEIDQNEKQ